MGGNLAVGPTKSDPTGFFRVTLRPGVRVGQTATVSLRHPDYRPLDYPEYLQDRLYVLRLVPRAPASLDRPVVIGDLRVRYTVKSGTTVNVGSASKTFEVVNNGDIPCPRHSPCSPDGKWKAAIGGASIDAGEGNQFHDARVSCLAGPCPFTKIENDSFSKGGPHISVSVRNWSDTASFLLEAEVARTTTSDEIRESFPVIFGQTMSFTLPPPAQGSSVEATVNAAEIVYPFERALSLSWAGCDVNVAKDGTRLYRCELKPGYRFR
ncbi:MAG TPA: carboxypeptidase regulatory-like domain-containing protein [Bryobacteraceae bacterium]|nr:carboxypeptidase regulatory-like domain-containing protein [Bryobacteraceae bacterium]